MKVCKGTRLTTKYNPYCIELINTYYFLAEFSANPSQAGQTTNTESQFKISAAIRRYEKNNNKFNKNIIKNKAITMAEDGCNVMKKHKMTKGQQDTINETQTDTHKNKPTICQRAKIENAFITATHHRTNSITRDGKHVHIRNSPTIDNYHKNGETKMWMYDSGTDGHYLRKKDRKQLGLPVFLQLSNAVAEVDTFKEIPTSLMSVVKK